MSAAGDRPVAVVTGGASGFGLALATELAGRGFDLGLFDIDEARVRADVESAEQVERAAAAVGERFGRCDLLWVNVGVQHFGAVESVPDEVWRWVLDVNVVGAARTVRAFLPLLWHADGARIAFTASANALAPAARLGAYQASKYALVGLVETVRIELAEEQIGVSIVYPSGMMTRHLESSAAARPATAGPGDVSDDDLQAMMASRPMTEADLTTADDAAGQALAEVLAGESYVITHGDLAAPVTARHADVDPALARLAARRDAGG